MLEFGDYFYELDFSKYDTTQSTRLLESTELQLIKHVTNEEISSVWQNIVHGVNKGRLQTGGNYVIDYEIEGTKMSGEVTTSPGNTFIAYAIIESYLRQENIQAKHMHEGDDTILISQMQLPHDG